METILVIIFLSALVAIPVSLIVALIKKLLKKPAKKTMKFTGVSVLVLILSFVGVAVFAPDSPDSSEPNETQSSVVSSNEVTTTPDDNSSDNKKPDKSGKGNSIFGALFGNNDAAYIGDNTQLRSLGYMPDMYEHFSEGRAWVLFSDPKDNRRNKVAIIDKQGCIVWESESTEASLPLLEKSVFRDGVAYCLFDGDSQDTYMLFDDDGNVTFSMNYDGEYIILGHGNGMFLAAEHIQTFETNEWRIGAIDKNGATIIPFQVYEKDPPPGPDAVEAPSGMAPDPNYDYWGYLDYMEQLAAYEEYMSYSYTPEPLSFDVYDMNDSDNFGYCEYMGDNVYKIASSYDRWYVLLNIETQEVIYTYDIDYGNEFGTGWIEFISPFENGVATVLHDYAYLTERGIYENRRAVCELTTSGDLTPIADNRFTDDILIGRTDLIGEGLLYLGANDLEMLFPSGVYYNLEGECVIDFPEYRGKYRYWGGSFHNGHAVMNLEGADGKVYITAINKNGEFLFEPQVGYSAAASVDGEYILAFRDGCIAIYDFGWNPVVTIECGCISMSGLENLGTVDEGVFRFKNVYISLEDETVIGKHGPHTNSEMKVTWH